MMPGSGDLAGVKRGVGIGACDRIRSPEYIDDLFQPDSPVLLLSGTNCRLTGPYVSRLA